MLVYLWVELRFEEDEVLVLKIIQAGQGGDSRSNHKRDEGLRARGGTGKGQRLPRDSGGPGSSSLP